MSRAKADSSPSRAVSISAASMGRTLGAMSSRRRPGLWGYGKPRGAPRAAHRRPSWRPRVLRGPVRLALWLPYVEVADVGEATERARALGAAVVLEPREGPAGWRSVVAAAPAGE